MKPERIEQLLRRTPADEPKFVGTGAPAHVLVRRVKVSGRQPAGAIGLALAAIAITAVLVAQPWSASVATAPVTTPSGAPATSTPSSVPSSIVEYSEQCGAVTATASEIAATPEPLTSDEQAVIAEAVGRAPTLLPASSWHRLVAANGNETFVAIGSPNPVRRFVFISTGPVAGGTIGLGALGDCMPVVRWGDGLAKISWTLEVDPAATMRADATLLKGYIAAARWETVAGSTVSYVQGYVSITLWTKGKCETSDAEPSGVVAGCQTSAHLVPVTVKLAEPLGGREVDDGLTGRAVQTSPPLPSGG